MLIKMSFLFGLMVFLKSKESDLSTAESGSDVDDVLSPQSNILHHPTLTPVREEVLIVIPMNVHPKPEP